MMWTIERGNEKPVRASKDEGTLRNANFYYLQFLGYLKNREGIDSSYNPFEGNVVIETTTMLPS